VENPLVLSGDGGLFTFFPLSGVSGFADVFPVDSFRIELNRKHNLGLALDSFILLDILQKKTVKLSSNLHFVANADTRKPPLHG